MDVEWRVVTQENIEAYLESISVADEYVFFAISVRDYERMALNLDELRRYIEQQQQIIIFYESTIQGQ